MSDILLVTVDGSPQSLKAIDYAVKLAHTSGFTIELLHVQSKINTHYANKKIGKKQLLEYKKEEAIKILDMGRKRVDKGINMRVKWRLGITSREICDEADKVEAIGIIMGVKNMGKVKGRLLGSTCYSVIRNAPCPVMLVS
ncbi:universal stress protein [Aquibacillus rhizosphaerae]|uniref:Universal stress protein n=1 Tax=Aquibacillus rhizosphaerae TaxID=3051431 RepID=A0ABT7L8J9_9BACI|nr:universal stress protein [Aquibacillus sp. LR5S19]MDL4842187.1 universal stress protein [Aquibacillus sp. LR5S19]